MSNKSNRNRNCSGSDDNFVQPTYSLSPIRFAELSDSNGSYSPPDSPVFFRIDPDAKPHESPTYSYSDHEDNLGNNIEPSTPTLSILTSTNQPDDGEVEVSGVKQAQKRQRSPMDVQSIKIIRVSEHIANIDSDLSDCDAAQKDDGHEIALVEDPPALLRQANLHSVDPGYSQSVSDDRRDQVAISNTGKHVDAQGRATTSEKTSQVSDGLLTLDGKQKLQIDLFRQHAQVFCHTTKIDHKTCASILADVRIKELLQSKKSDDKKKLAMYKVVYEAPQFIRPLSFLASHRAHKKNFQYYEDALFWWHSSTDQEQ